jgi:hypothetical protein
MNTNLDVLLNSSAATEFIYSALVMSHSHDFPIEVVGKQSRENLETETYTPPQLWSES